MFEIELSGKIYRAETQKELKKVLRKNNQILSDGLFKKLLKNEPIDSYLVNKKTKEVIKLDVRKDNRPLLKTQFKIKNKDMPISKFKKNIRFIDLNKDYKISSIMPKNAKIRIILTIKIKIRISEDIRNMTITKSYFGFNNKDKIEEFVDNEIEKYLNNVDVDEFIESKYSVSSQYTEAKMKFEDMILRDHNILQIFNDNVENVKPPEGENCVKYYINNKYKGFKKKLKNWIDEPTISQLKDFCAVNDICFRCYDINKNLISSHVIKNTKSKQAALNIVAYNNHIYPFKNNFLNKKPKNKYIFKYVKDINKELIKYLDSGRLPAHVSTAGENELCYFTTDKNECISNNDEYELCLKLLNLMA
jgi:hypothetical protein